MERKTRVVLLTVAALLAVAFAIYQVRAFFGPEVKNGHLPADFPHAFISPADNGNVAAVRIFNGRTPPDVLERDGVRTWPAHVCRNEACPGAHGGEGFVFAYGWDPEAHPGPSTVCPQCAAAKLEPTHIQRWYTPEAEAILVTVRDSLGIQ